MERAASDLKLKPEQKARVRKILEETGADLATTTADVRPKVEEIMGRGEERIREVLDVKQRRKFDRFVNEGRRRWKAAIEARTTPTPHTPGQQAAPQPSTTGHPERSAGESKDL